MARFIDVDKLLMAIKKRHTVRYFTPTKEDLQLIDIFETIKTQPTADVVEVVRCKDCIFYEPHGNGKVGICRHSKLKRYLKHNIDFCSYGERK